MAMDASTRPTSLSAHYLDPSKAVAFFDIDGTLVWRDFELSPAVVRLKEL